MEELTLYDIKNTYLEDILDKYEEFGDSLRTLMFRIEESDMGKYEEIYDDCESIISLILEDKLDTYIGWLMQDVDRMMKNVDLEVEEDNEDI